MARPCPRAWESVYVRGHVECGAFTGDGLTKYIQTHANEYETQSLVENNRCEIENETEYEAQSIPQSIGTLTVLWCNFGSNLEILTTIRGDSWRGQTHKLKPG